MKENIFPFFPNEVKEFEEENVEETDEICREIEWDYEKNIPLIKDGNFVIVEGLEAIKTWCWKTLNTERYKHLIYSWNYGVDMEQFVGQTFNSLTKVEIIKEITEALLQNKYVTGVNNFNITKENRKVFIDFNINTKYGSLNDRKEVKL